MGDAKISLRWAMPQRGRPSQTGTQGEGETGGVAKGRSMKSAVVTPVRGNPKAWRPSTTAPELVIAVWRHHGSALMPVAASLLVGERQPADASRQLRRGLATSREYTTKSAYGQSLSA